MRDILIFSEYVDIFSNFNTEIYFKPIRTEKHINISSAVISLRKLVR